MLENIRIILIETSHPGNIGSTARAMKTMGLSDLVLVNPAHEIDGLSVAMAAHADDLLRDCKIVDSLDEALEGCHLIMGTSARKRYLDWPLITPREAAAKANDTIRSDMKVAVLFGRERNGLINTELERCNMHIHIPTNPDYQSLNLSQAVQLISYEMRVAIEGVEEYQPKDKLASSEQVEQFFTAYEKALLQMKCLNPKAPRKLMPRLKRLFLRAEMEDTEVNILRGITEAMIALSSDDEG